MSRFSRPLEKPNPGPKWNFAHLARLLRRVFLVFNVLLGNRDGWRLGGLKFLTLIQLLLGTLFSGHDSLLGEMVAWGLDTYRQIQSQSRARTGANQTTGNERDGAGRIARVGEIEDACVEISIIR